MLVFPSHYYRYLILEQNHKCGWRLTKAEYASRGFGQTIAEAAGFPPFIEQDQNVLRPRPGDEEKTPGGWVLGCYSAMHSLT